MYIDDILVATTNIEHHLKVLEKLFKTMVANKLEIKIWNCKFLGIIEYLGYEISKQGIAPTEKGLETVMNFGIPENIHGVRRSIGLCFSIFESSFKTFQ